jgi:hypothetical protein
MDVALRPWRTAALVASALAAVELVVLLVLAVAFLGKPVAARMDAQAEQRAFAPAPKPKPAPAAPSAPKLARGETSVLVLNGNGRAGAASAAGAQVKRLGYPVASVGNAPRSDYERTLVLYRPGLEAEGRRLAKDLRGGAVAAPLDGLRPAQLMGAHLAVILGER